MSHTDPTCGSCDYTSTTTTSDVSINASGVQPSGTDCDCLVYVLRATIGDFSTPPTYSDVRLKSVLAAAAFYLTTDLSSSCSNVSVPTSITCGECPSDALSYPEYSALLILRAACILDQSIIRNKSQSSGLSASCGPAKISVSSSSAENTLLIKTGACEEYQKLKHDLCFKSAFQNHYFYQVMGAFSTWTGVNCHYKKVANSSRCGSC